jgi:hypothetical protein
MGLKMSDYSHKDFTNWDLSDRTDMDGITITGSCFFQQAWCCPFPLQMTGVTFIYCNLDNAEVPPGNTIIGGNNRRLAFKEDDKTCWIVDADGDFLECIDG